jgi:hypothetical protein
MNKKMVDTAVKQATAGCRYKKSQIKKEGFAGR